MYLQIINKNPFKGKMVLAVKFEQNQRKLKRSYCKLKQAYFQSISKMK